MKLFSSSLVQIRPFHSVHGTTVPQRQQDLEKTSNKLCKCPVARRASGAFGWVVQGTWSDGKSMLPLLFLSQSLQTPHTAPVSPNPHHTGATGGPLQFAWTHLWASAEEFWFSTIQRMIFAAISYQICLHSPNCLWISQWATRKPLVVRESQQIQNTFPSERIVN